MNNRLRYLMVLAGALIVGLGAVTMTTMATEAETSGRIESWDEKRAKALLERAVAHVEKGGEAAVADFSRQAEFIDHDLYVFALRTDGQFLASGGASSVLIGENVLDQTDLVGKPFFREIVDLAASQGGGRVEYRWFNPADSRGEPKLTMFRRVGDIIVAVGFYPPRATPQQARALLRDAIAALRDDEQGALAEFAELDGRFIRDDLYVFVVSVADGRFLAHGASPELVGTDGHALRDPEGKAVVSEMLDIAQREGEGELDYVWRNPTTGRLESKHTYFRVVDGKLVGVGYYTR